MPAPQSTPEDSSIDVRVGEALSRALTLSGKTKSRICVDIGEEHRPVQMKQLLRYLKGESTIPLALLEKFAEATGTNVQGILAEAGIVPKFDLSAIIDSDLEIDELSRMILKSAYETARRESAQKHQGLGRDLR